MASNIRFKHPFTCVIGGPTGSGKSMFCIRFCKTLTHCVQSRILQVELSGVRENRMPCLNNSWLR